MALLADKDDFKKSLKSELEELSGTADYKARMCVNLVYQTDGDDLFRVSDITTYTVHGNVDLIYGANPGEIDEAHDVDFFRYDALGKRISLFSEEEQLTNVLQSKADRFETWLLKKNVESGTHVGIKVEYSIAQNTLFHWISRIPIIGYRMFVSVPDGFQVVPAEFMRPSKLDPTGLATDRRYEMHNSLHNSPTVLASDRLILPYQGVGWSIVRTPLRKGIDRAQPTRTK